MKQNKRFKKWFASRMQVADKIVLQQRSTYILPTKAGVLMSSVIMLMMIGATNYQNNLAFLLTFLVISIGLISIIVTFRNLQGLVFELAATESVCAGETMYVNLLAYSQDAQKHWSIGCGFEQHPLVYNNILTAQGSSFVIPLLAPKRGWYDLPRIGASSVYPFGFLKVWTWFRFKTPILIYPKLIEPPNSGSDGFSDDDKGEPQHSGNDELFGLKIYQKGEPLSRIDWKALARERGLFSKDFKSLKAKEPVFSWDDYEGVETELRLSYLSFQVVNASAIGDSFGLRLPGKVIAKNSGPQHQQACLSALAVFGMKP
ncbi:MAG: DUF58 domain-containing protein [Enterobacterales bacterium]|nr:DUF58 domain-containing protein [Enterobacterales bacterium]